MNPVFVILVIIAAVQGADTTIVDIGEVTE